MSAWIQPCRGTLLALVVACSLAADACGKAGGDNAAPVPNLASQAGAVASSIASARAAQNSQPRDAGMSGGKEHE